MIPAPDVVAACRLTSPGYWRNYLADWFIINSFTPDVVSQILTKVAVNTKMLNINFTQYMEPVEAFLTYMVKMDSNFVSWRKRNKQSLFHSIGWAAFKWVYFDYFIKILPKPYYFHKSLSRFINRVHLIFEIWPHVDFYLLRQVSIS